MRVLIDYRPALRGRSGVGEYTHELASALLARAAADPHRPLDVTLFSSSWKDRLQPRPELCGAIAVDLRIPVSAPQPALASPGTGPGRVAHPRGLRRRPLVSPAAAAGAARGAGRHDPRPELPGASRADPRRDPPRLPGLVASHAARADAIIVPSHFTASEVAASARTSRRTGCTSVAPARRTGRLAPRLPADGYLLFFGTLEPRKNVGGAARRVRTAAGAT